MRSIHQFRSRRLPAATLAILILLGNQPGGGSRAWAQAPAGEQSGADRLRQMTALAKTFTVAGTATANRSPRGPSADPIFRYDEPARGFLDGTLWAFGGQGRPLAVLKAEIHATGVVYGLVSLAPETVSARGFNGWRWSSTRPRLNVQPIPGAPTPAVSGRERLLQIKALARRFSAIEDDGPSHGKITLRLLPQPIHHYADPTADKLDGMIFGFATGTNPDILLLIESTQMPDAPTASWKYGFARIGGADLSGRLDGKVVWHEDVALVPSNFATYANFLGARDDLKP